MGSRPTASVAFFLAKLDHPLITEILALRQLVLGVDPTITEDIKWNAPSFRTSEHFATMHLRARDSLRLILHVGTRKRVIPPGAIVDPEGLLRWLGPGRASVTFSERGDVAARAEPMAAIISQWIEHVQ